MLNEHIWLGWGNRNERIAKGMLINRDLEHQSSKICVPFGAVGNHPDDEELQINDDVMVNHGKDIKAFIDEGLRYQADKFVFQCAVTNDDCVEFHGLKRTYSVDIQDSDTIGRINSVKARIRIKLIGFAGVDFPPLRIRANSFIAA